MDFHRGEGPEVAGEVVGGEILGFFNRFALEEFGGHGGDGDGRLAAEGLEGGAVDDLLAVLFGEFEPHAEHVPTIDRSSGAHGIGVFHLAQIAGVGDGLAGSRFKVLGGWVAHGGAAGGLWPLFSERQREMLKFGRWACQSGGAGLECVALGEGGFPP